MNRTLRKLSVLILSGCLLMVSCGKDDDAAVDPNNPNNPENPENPNNPSNPTTGTPDPTKVDIEFPTEFSEKTAEQNKSELQNNGIELVNKFTTFKNSSGIQTSIAFGKHLEGSVMPDNFETGRVAQSRAMTLIQALAAVGRGQSPAMVSSAMRVNASEFESFEKYYNEVAGVYTYTKANDTWTYSKTGNKVVFKFPSTEKGSTNNAEYTVYEYKGTKVSSPIGGDDYDGEYPSGLKIDLTIDGTKKMEFVFSATYDAKGTPTAVSTSIKIDDYVLSYDLTNTITDAKTEFALRQNGNYLMGFGGRAKGSFNAGEVKDSDDATIGDAAGYAQILNIKVTAQLNAKELRNALNATDTRDGDVAAWNKHFKPVVFYADSKKKIADGEMYKITQPGSEKYCHYDDLNGDGKYTADEYICETYTWTDEWTDMRMVFQDGTKADFKTYTETGFSQLLDELEKFADSLD